MKPGTLRIIGGIYKKKRLLSVPGSDTRPTTDRLRETIFNIISSDIRGAAVLDLFAGTGAMGLEALSRGASSCVFIENSSQALTVIRKNCMSCSSLSGRIDIKACDITRGLSCLKNPVQPFSIVFIDPPYGQNMLNNTFISLSETESLADDALIVVEHHVDDLNFILPDSFNIIDQRKYGRSALTFLQNKKPVT